MQGLTAFFPMEIPDETLVEAMAKQFRLRRDQIFIYTEPDELLEMEDRDVSYSTIAVPK